MSLSAIESPISESTRALRLGIVMGSISARAPDGGVILNFALGRLLDQLRQHFPQARLCLPILPEARDVFDYRLGYPSEALVPLPPMGTTISSQWHYGQIRRIVRSFAAECDLLLLRLPFQTPAALVGLRKPKVLHVIGNPRSVVRASTDYRGIMRLVARGFAAHLERVMKRLVREPDTRVVTHGREMWDVLQCRAGRTVVSSSLYAHEMHPRADLRLNDPPRLLFVGFLRPEKGLGTLIEAFEQLRKQRPLRLTIVGGSDRPSQAEREIRERVARSPFSQDIDIRGSLPFGEDLFNLYREHDIYVLTSLSEGTPRTLVEARAFGCPVVATRVGGIPTSITEGRDGLLFEPGNAAELSATLLRVLDDDSLRLSLIREGIESARALSVENFAAQIAKELAALPIVESQRAFPKS